MSANFAKEDKGWLLSILTKQRPLSHYEEAIVFSAFDAETGQDIERIEKEIKQTKFLKRVCVMKLMVFIPEYLFSVLFFGKKTSRLKKELASLYYKFLFNKISLKNFKNQLNSLSKNSII
jgi:hypothetical protein